MSDFIYWVAAGCAVWHGGRGFYLDVVKDDREASIFHIAWLGVFLACLAGRA